MPEVRFVVIWPDGSREHCYSPSTIIADYLDADTDYPLAEFGRRAAEGLARASDRVRARYGMGCGHALSQAEIIKHSVARFATLPDAYVRVEYGSQEGSN